MTENKEVKKKQNVKEDYMKKDRIMKYFVFILLLNLKLSVTSDVQDMDSV